MAKVKTNVVLSTGWEVVDNVYTRSADVHKDRLALLRRANPGLEFRGYKARGPRGGTTYGIEVRRRSKR